MIRGAAKNRHYGRTTARALLHELCAELRKFGVADGSSLFQPIEFFDLIGNTEANNAPEFIARLLDLPTLRSAMPLP